MMNMNYIRPENSAEAVRRARRNPQAAFLAGGTDLLGVLRERVLPDLPRALVSLRDCGLNYIKEDEKNIRIGAMTTLDQIAKDPWLNEHMPVLTQAAGGIASPQIRHTATIGGNLCQQPRCWYYRHPDNRYDCLRKGGRTCSALTGNNTYHSIFGTMKTGRAACERQCPNHTPIPEYMEKMRQGDMDEAARLLLDANLLAPVMGRICVHTCQDECSRGEFDESVSIHEAERCIGDYGLANAKRLFPKPEADSGKSVAIIGAGPAGLSAAWELIRAGHRVTVYDALEKTGGMLRYGIPHYRLPREILDRIEEVLSDFGVAFRMNCELGKDISIEQLRSDYNATMVCMGAWEAMRLGCGGEDLKGVVSGIDFLKACACHEGPDLSGKKVAVVGAGNTAMDAARTGLRLGAASVDIISITDRDEAPASEEEMAGAAEEGASFHFLITAAEFLGGEGRLQRIRLQHTRPAEDGKSLPVPIEGAFEEMEADLAIVAIGQRPERRLRDQLRDELEQVLILGGEFRYGAGTAIESIADAKESAAKVSRLFGRPLKEDGDAPVLRRLSFDPSYLAESKQMQPAERPVPERTLCEEDRMGSDMEEVLRELKRCFNCGCAAVSPSDLAPAVIALEGVCVTDRREIPAREFFSSKVCSSTVLEQGELLLEIILPKSAAGQIQCYRKFRLRQAIDFPVMGLASNIHLTEDGVIASAALVTSGTAPVPFRLTDAESMLTGCKASEELSVQAGAAAVSGAVPLKENRYKKQVLKAFVRRAVADAIGVNEE